LPPLLSERPERTRIILAVVVPFVFGAVAGVFVSVSAAVYWVLAVLAAIGGVLAGTEHPDPASGAKRVLLGGALFGAGIVIAHAVAGGDAKVSLGDIPAFLIVVDGVIGAILGAIGGAISRSRRSPAV
jgi:hypothetical protein